MRQVAATARDGTLMTPNTRCTTDHDKIRTWIENHQGVPVQIPGATWARAADRLRAEFDHGRSGQDLEPLSWRAWFAIFDEHELTFCFPDYEDSTAFRLMPRTPHPPP